MLSKLFGSKESFFTLKIAGVEQAISISSKETILHAALKQGIKFPVWLEVTRPLDSSQA